MNATAEWTKHDDWTPWSGPWYRHATNRVAISGHYGTVGDNVRGWRKTRIYAVVRINEDGTTERVSNYRTVTTAKAAAEKILAG